MKTIENQVLQGDNLAIMKSLPSNSIDLIYIDPPFFLQRNFETFNDTWKSLDHYLGFMRERLIECHRLLSSSGIFCLQVNWRAVHYLKVEADKIWGYKNFVNEIIWKMNGVGRMNGPRYKSVHDTILIYSKSKKFYSDIEKGPLSESSLKRYENLFDENGDVTIKALKTKQPGTYAGLLKAGRIRKNDNPKKIFFSKRVGTSLTDCWTDIKSFGARSKDVVYPTQKPPKLLERVVKSWSAEGDMVADFFCGSGTTLAVANKLGRKYFGCDISEEAIKITKSRLK